MCGPPDGADKKKKKKSWDFPKLVMGPCKWRPPPLRSGPIKPGL